MAKVQSKWRNMFGCSLLGPPVRNRKITFINVRRRFRKRPAANYCRREQWVGKSSRTPLLDEEVAPFQYAYVVLERTKIWSWVPKPRMTVLSKTSRKLLLRSFTRIIISSYIYMWKNSRIQEQATNVQFWYRNSIKPVEPQREAVAVYSGSSETGL
jgi:hypothetical protein